MTEIVPDTVEVDCFIGNPNTEPGEDVEKVGLPWHVIEAEVEISQIATPNYVDMKITPDPEETVPELPPAGDISKIVGQNFILKADNQLISNRDTDAEEDSLLFQGRLANISPIGENTFEAIAYDPFQQAFNIGEDSGSVINKSINLSSPKLVDPDDVDDIDAEGDGSYTYKAKRLVNLIADFAGLDDTVIRLREGGYIINGRTYGENDEITFNRKYVSVKAALNAIREKTESDWWFDKRGTFYFGAVLPDQDVNVHRLKFIKSTSAGITTPPYQSVEVVGKGLASKEGWSYGDAIAEPSTNIVKRGRIGQPTGTVEVPTGDDQNVEGEGSGALPDSDLIGGGDDEEETEEQEIGRTAQKIIIEDELAQPVFRYVNAEISTQRQAAGTMRSILDELIKQQADGEITVVGFPEITPFDGLQMPGTTNDQIVNNPARDEPPMGGRQYGVYKVKHRLNPSDGFITKITVSGPTNITNKAFIDADDLITDVNVDRRVYDDSQFGIYDETPGSQPNFGGGL